MTHSVEAQRILTRYQNNPLAFFREILGCEPWSGQVEILEAVAKHPEVAVKSCHSLGKDWLSARILLWFAYCHSPSLVISTAPTDRQVKGILWQEVAVAHASAKVELGGKILKQELQISPEQNAHGFTATAATQFQGWHCPNVMIIVDEAAGIDSEIYTGIDSCLASGIKTRRLEIGNPTDPTSEFAKSFKTPGIVKMSYDAFQTPNFTHFGITEEDMFADAWMDKITGDLPAPWLVTPDWVSKRYNRWGPLNPLYASRVAALFPEEGEDTLISLTQIEAAQKRTLAPGTPDVLGVDVARFGSDFSVIASRQGPVVRIIKRFWKADTMTTSGHARREYMTRKPKPKRVHVDVVGIGSGVVDRLREQRVPVVEASAGSSASDKEMFLNQRAEWFWTLREEFEAGEIDLDPADEELAAQLADIKWKPDSKGRVTIERKEDMKKRGLHSPDDADAVAMCFSQSAKFIDKYKRAMANM